MDWMNFNKTLIKTIEKIKMRYPEYHYYSDPIGCVSIEVWDGYPPIIQKCLDLEMDCSLPISTIKFKKNQSLMALLFVLSKICCMYSDQDDYVLYLNKESIDMPKFITLENDWEKIKTLIKDKENIFAIYHLDESNYNYFLFLLVHPLYKDEEVTEKYWIKEWEKWKK